MNPILKDSIVWDTPESRALGCDFGEKIITVCAWCHPGDTVLEVYPQLRGIVKISHGICAEHKKEMLDAINGMSQLGRIE